MGRFVLRRLASGALLLVLVPSLTFVYFAATYSEAPVLSGLLDYLEATFVHFDLGQAKGFGSPDVATLLGTGVAVDLALLTGAMVLGVGFGIAGGAVIAHRRRPRVRAIAYLLGAVALAAPVAVTAYVFVFYFGSEGGNHRVPFVSDAGVYRPLTADPLAWLHALWVPWLAVGLPIAGAVMRVTVGATREALAEDAIRTARAKGVAEGPVLRRHAVPLAVGPVSAFSGATLNLLILNGAIVQEIFNLPGSFRFAKQAIDDGDLALLQSLTLVTVFYVVAGNLVADLVHARVDPRVRRA